MITSSFKKRRKFLHRTPGYRNFQPIRSLYFTVVFKFGAGPGLQNSTKEGQACVFVLCVCVVFVFVPVRVPSLCGVYYRNYMRSYVFCLCLCFCFYFCCCFLFYSFFSAKRLYCSRARFMCVCVLSLLVHARVRADCPRSC